MIDIQKLAKLTWLHLSTEEQQHLWQQLESVASLLDKVKEYDIPTPTTTRHDILWLETKPSKSWISDGTPKWILRNIAHPITGHAVEVRAFVE
jgi:Asp-tRNA(Asn)/Glu-tRNA(Gln) amidotransferase C subunit